MRKLFCYLLFVSIAALACQAAPTEKPGGSSNWNFQMFAVDERDNVVTRRLVKDLDDLYTGTGDVRFEITGDSMNTIFELDGTKLYVLHKLDREQQAVYPLTVKVYNDKNVLIEEPREIKIVVKDQNDNAPIFLNGNVVARIPENAAKDSVVQQMHATDADDADYGKIVYKIVKGSNGVFTINSDTGVVTLLGKLDRETQDLYELVITATDSPEFMQDVHVTNTTLSVSVIDVNDNAPYFETPYVESTVLENADYATVVTELQAVDKDTDKNSQMAYRLVEESEFFMVKTARNKGVLMIKKPLDFEATNDHSYSVQVRVDNTVDLVEGAQMADGKEVVVVEVKVENVNEPPLISESNLKFHVNENVAEGHLVGQMTAMDPENDAFSWRIKAPDNNTTSKFSINSKGELRVAGDLDREDVDSYEVVVMAGVFDGPAPLFSQVSVNIIVDDVNDNAPVPLPESRTLILCQNSNDKFQKLKPDLKAIDADSKSVNGIFTFTKADDPTYDNNFKLMENKKEGNAAIYTIRDDFDASTVEEYVLRYIISDGGNPAMNATYTTTVRVCQCMEDNTSVCGAQAIRSLVGIGTPVILIICVVAFLLITVIVAVGLVHRRRRAELEDRLIRESTKSDDHEFNTGIGDRCEGGGEEDNLDWSLPHLMDGIRGNQIAESSIVPMRMEKQMALPTGNHLEYIEECKSKMDQDTDGLPYDSIQVYGYEGEGSLAGSLSSIASGSVDSEQDYDYLNEWGPKFEKLANIYGHGSDESEQLRN